MHHSLTQQQQSQRQDVASESRSLTLNTPFSLENNNEDLLAFSPSLKSILILERFFCFSNNNKSQEATQELLRRIQHLDPLKSWIIRATLGNPISIATFSRLPSTLKVFQLGSIRVNHTLDVHVLANALQGHTCLEQVSIESLCLHCHDIAKGRQYEGFVLNPLLQAAATIPHLKSFELSCLMAHAPKTDQPFLSCGVFQDFLMRCKNLKELSLVKLGLQELHLQVLKSHLLQPHATLTKAVWNDNSYSQEGFRESILSIIKYNASLKVLKVYSPYRVAFEDGQKLVELLSSNTTLHTLDVNLCLEQKETCKVYLSLNRARKQEMENDSLTVAQCLDMLEDAQGNLSAIFSILRIHPEVCQHVSSTQRRTYTYRPPSYLFKRHTASEYLQQARQKASDGLSPPSTMTLREQRWLYHRVTTPVSPASPRSYTPTVTTQFPQEQPLRIVTPSPKQRYSTPFHDSPRLLAGRLSPTATTTGSSIKPQQLQQQQLQQRVHPLPISSSRFTAVPSQQQRRQQRPHLSPTTTAKSRSASPLLFTTAATRPSPTTTRRNAKSLGLSQEQRKQLLAPQLPTSNNQAVPKDSYHSYSSPTGVEDLNVMIPPLAKGNHDHDHYISNGQDTVLSWEYIRRQEYFLKKRLERRRKLKHERENGFYSSSDEDDIYFMFGAGADDDSVSETETENEGLLGGSCPSFSTDALRVATSYHRGCGRRSPLR